MGRPNKHLNYSIKFLNVLLCLLHLFGLLQLFLVLSYQVWWIFWLIFKYHRPVVSVCKFVYLVTLVSFSGLCPVRIYTLNKSCSTVPLRYTLHLCKKLFTTLLWTCRYDFYLFGPGFGYGKFFDWVFPIIQIVIIGVDILNIFFCISFWNVGVLFVPKIFIPYPSCLM